MKRFLVMIVLICTTSALAQDFIRPVAGTPAYNGTYKGKPGSGAAKYTTLYRDNQDNGYKSGCRGEGCGRHPGVDIAVPSGTGVVAPLAGTVVISRCDASWGGLIVLKSVHPIRSWEYIFQTFAHLRSRNYNSGVSVSVGDLVSAGSVIGRSGGSSSDKCSGSSTGSHLHYQIDKDDGNSEPWFPGSTAFNSRDDNFAVSEKTYNPIVFLQGGYRWSFDENGNRELWDLYNFSTWGMQDGSLWMDGNTDPFIRRGGITGCGLNKPCSSSIAIDSSEFKTVFLDLYNSCASSYGKVYFITSQENSWDESKTVYYFTSSVFGGLTARIDMSVNPKWSGVISGLRIDPAEQCLVGIYDPVYFGEIAILR